MKKREALIVIILAAVSTLITAIFIAPAAVDTFALYPPEALRSTAPLLHFSYNSFIPWRISSAALDLLSYITPLLLPFGDLTPALILLAIFSAGVALLIRLLDLIGQVGSVFLATIFSLSVLLVYGEDHLLLGAVSSFCWLVTALVLAVQNKRSALGALLFLVLVSIFTVSSSLAFSAVVVPFAVVFCLAIVEAFNLQFRLEGELQKWIIAILLLIPVAINSYYSPLLPLPDYPQLAHLVTDDGVAGRIKPLVSQMPEVAFVNRQYLRETFSIIGLAMFSLSLAVLLVTVWLVRFKKLHLVAPLCFLLVALDTAIAEDIAQIMPLYSLSRIIPLGAFYPLVPLAFFFGLLSFLFSLLSLSRRATFIALPLALAGLLVFNFQNERVLFERAGHRALAASTVALGDWVEPGEREVIFSPSYNLIATEGIEVVLNRSRYHSRMFEQPGQKITFAPTNTELNINPAQILDQDSTTRWSVAGGQVGGETFCLAFEEEVVLSGLKLLQGEFASDFPRGIELIKVDDCGVSSGETLFKRAHWEGPVRYSAKGYPYWGWQGDVEIIFARDVVVRNLLVRQIGKSDHFDWSVSGVKFLFP